MTHSFDDPATPDFTSLLMPAQRLRITTAGLPRPVHLVRRREDAHARAAGPRGRTVRCRAAIPRGNQEAARHAPSGVPHRHRRAEPDRCLLADHDLALPRALHPVDPAGPGRGIQPTDGRLLGRACVTPPPVWSGTSMSSRPMPLDGSVRSSSRPTIRRPCWAASRCAGISPISSPPPI